MLSYSLQSSVLDGATLLVNKFFTAVRENKHVSSSNYKLSEHGRRQLRNLPLNLKERLALVNVFFKRDNENIHLQKQNAAEWAMMNYH